MYLDLHASHGVRMLMGTGVTAFEGTDAVERVLTTDGRTVDCDLVVVGAGAQPNVALAAQARLRIDDGVLVDEHLRTSAPGIFAAGDVAKAYSPSRAQWIRVEHWANALNQGRAAARSMLGHPEQPYDRVPYFYSDQYDVAMEYSGFAHGFDRIVLRGDLASHELVAFWLAGDRVIAGMGVNRWSATEPIRALIRERTPVDDAALADPDVPLEELAPVASGWAA
jgi:3-phenylpropionate/trans-cinnamate dioxygenase ferredoxin reductase component